MIRISLTSLWARKRRLASTAVAVVLGVAFLTGTLVLGDTLSNNFDRLFAEVSAGTDVVVRNAAVVESDTGADDSRGPLDEALIDKVQEVDGVAAAEGQVVGYGALISRDGDQIGGNGPPRLAGSWITDPDLNPYKLVEGRAPQAADEVVVNRGAAEAGDLKLGDTTTVQVPAPVEVTIVGIATFGDADGLGTTTWTAFTLDAAQEHITSQTDKVNTILVRAEDGASSDDLQERITAALPDGSEAITGTQLAGERSDEISSTFLDGLRAALVVFAGIALVVATLSISNTFAITVAQRTRELALLRAVGATRRQVRRAVTIEALGLGLIAATIGVVAGLGVAGLLKGMFDLFGFALPAGGMEIKPVSLAIGLFVGVAATTVAAQAAARRASKLAPVEALRETSAEARAIGRRRIVVGAAVIITGVTVSVVGAVSGSLIPTAVGALALVVGTLMSAPIALAPVAGVVGGALRRARGVNGMMAEQNARRNPRRSAATATALVVGVAVVSLFTVFAASIKGALSDQLSTDFSADLTVSTSQFGGAQLGPSAADEVAALDEVDAAVGLGGGAVLVNGDDTEVTATDPTQVVDVAQLDVLDGSFDAVGAVGDANGIAVDDSRAEDRGWEIGSGLEMTFADGVTEAVTVQAIYDDNSLVGRMVVADELWAAHTAQPLVRGVLIDVADGVGLAEAKAAIEPVADRVGGDVQDADEFASAATQGLDLLLSIIYVLLALAVLIALLGISNTLSLAVHERRRELGLLRAVGQTRRQVRSVLRLESVIISVFGTIVGLALGTFLGWTLFATVASGSPDLGSSLSLPVVQLVVITVLGALAGVLAARRPAKRAARIPVLEAIATQ